MEKINYMLEKNGCSEGWYLRVFAYDGRYAWSQSDAYQVFVICIRQILHMTDQFSWSHWVRHIQVHLYNNIVWDCFKINNMHPLHTDVQLIYSSHRRLSSFLLQITVKFLKCQTTLILVNALTHSHLKPPKVFGLKTSFINSFMLPKNCCIPTKIYRSTGAFQAVSVSLNPLAARTTYGTIWGTGYTIARHERDTTEKPMCHVL